MLARSPEGASEWSESGSGSTDPNQLPVFTDGSSATRTLAENTTGTSAVGDPVDATDPENTTLTYSLQGANANSFTVDPRSGQLNARSGKTWDFETKSNYRVAVKVEDGHGGVRTIPVSIDLIDLNEPPKFTSGTAFEAPENTTFASLVRAEDPDRADDVARFTLTGGVDRNLFRVNSGGVLSFKNATDFEKPADAGRNNQYTVAVTATGGVGGRAMNAEQTITVTVTDRNEPPRFTSDDVLTVRENNRYVGRVAAEDVDMDDEITGYEIHEIMDGDNFVVTNGNELYFKENPDFERPADVGSDNRYTVVIIAAGGTGSRRKIEDHGIFVTVKDDVEPPNMPDPPTVTDTTESSLTLTWTEPANTGPDITNYHVQYRHTGAYVAWSDSGAALSRTLTGLRSNTTYQFQVQARNDEGMGSWSNAGSGRTLTAPTVSSVAFTSTPASGQNNSYKLNDTLDVAVTFSEAVTVSGMPQMGLTIGSAVRQADYESGSTTPRLLFQYTVVVGDEDADGATINESGLMLNGGSIVGSNSARNGDLFHAALANQSRHKVDGRAPALTRGMVRGRRVDPGLR